MYHIVIIYSSIDGHPGLLHFLAIKNRTTINIDVQVSLWEDEEIFAQG